MNQGLLPVLGALLAGGRSRRFGSPKALARLDGVRLIDRARTAIEAAGLRPLLVDREGDRLGPALGLASVPDARPHRGPLSGLVAALRVAADRGLAGVVAVGVDQPLLPAEFLRHVAELGLSGAHAVAAEGPQSLEPLGAFYAAAALPVAEAHLAGGEGSLRSLLEALPTRRISRMALARFGEIERLFLNVNTPDDLVRAEQALAAMEDPGAQPQSAGVGALPRVYCVVGWKNAGKTGFTVRLVAELRRRGRVVMTAKHGHGFDLDRAGTDSWRMRHEGGARRVAVVGPKGGAVMGDWGADGEPALSTVVERYLADADIVIAEGFKSSPYPKIEVFRAEGGEAQPAFLTEGALAGPLLAVVTDEVLPDLPEDVRTVASAGAVADVADLIEAG